VLYPALDVRGDTELLYALLDDFSPTAIDERPEGLRAFFGSRAARDAALTALSPRFQASAIDVPDEDWARRSQEGLRPVTVGRITIVPRVGARGSGLGARLSRYEAEIAIVIQPSMGFGTGHHATTRLCLEALQAFDVKGRSVIDIGTGSGVLAIAADRLGAARALGIDVDPDAIQSARENLAVNPEARAVSFEIADLQSQASMPVSDIVTANLTGALLARTAPAIARATAAGGVLIVSGLLDDERNGVQAAFTHAAGFTVEWERHEDGWTGLAMRRGGGR
jgi:ribosomal protein L11 methyltransferase